MSWSQVTDTATERLCSCSELQGVFVGLWVLRDHSLSCYSVRTMRIRHKNHMVQGVSAVLLLRLVETEFACGLDRLPEANCTTRLGQTEGEWTTPARSQFLVSSLFHCRDERCFLPPLHFWVRDTGNMTCGSPDSSVHQHPQLSAVTSLPNTQPS